MKFVGHKKIQQDGNRLEVTQRDATGELHTTSEIDLSAYMSRAAADKNGARTALKKDLEAAGLIPRHAKTHAARLIL